MNAIGRSRMSSSCFLIRCRSRSSGPRKRRQLDAELALAGRCRRFDRVHALHGPRFGGRDTAIAADATSPRSSRAACFARTVFADRRVARRQRGYLRSVATTSIGASRHAWQRSRCSDSDVAGKFRRSWGEVAMSACARCGQKLSAKSGRCPRCVSAQIAEPAQALRHGRPGSGGRYRGAEPQRSTPSTWTEPRRALRAAHALSARSKTLAVQRCEQARLCVRRGPAARERRRPVRCSAAARGQIPPPWLRTAAA